MGATGTYDHATQGISNISRVMATAQQFQPLYNRLLVIIITIMHANDLCDCKKENKDDLKRFSREQCQKHWTFKTATSLSAYTKCTVCMEVKSVFIVFFFCHTRSVQFVSPFIKWLLLSGWSSEAKHFTEKLQKHKGYVFNDYYKKKCILFKRKIKW